MAAPASCISQPWASLVVGDVDSSADTAFTRILSLGAAPLRKPTAALADLLLDLQDTLHADLLAIVDSCVDFLCSSKREDTILVHCHAGQSRSVAACVASLMILGRLRLHDAFALVSASRPGARPNPSFVAQLRILDHLVRGEPCSLNGFKGGQTAAVARALRAWWELEIRMSSAHIAWLDTSPHAWDGDVNDAIGAISSLDVALLRGQAEQAVTASVEGKAPVLRVEELLQPPSEETCARLRRYCCGRCNTVLFSDANVVARHECDSAGDSSCSLVLVEPPQSSESDRTPPAAKKGALSQRESARAMARICFSGLPRLAAEDGGPLLVETTSGRLVCATCDAKVGSWDWSGRGGLACSCGEPVPGPALSVVRSRLVVRG